jgi:hypothetical protein
MRRALLPILLTLALPAVPAHAATCTGAVAMPTAANA